MKLIEADEAFRVLSAYYHHRTEGQADALRDALDRVPEAVVRCKDCQYRESSFCTCSHRDTDQFFYPEVNPDDYCSYGERREDERIHSQN